MDIVMIIDKKILKKTTNCKRNFACLSNDKQIICAAERCINNEVLFVKFPENEFCPYCMNYGGSFICLCPTRKEIFKNYGQ